MEAQSEHVHVACTFLACSAPICMLSRCLVTECLLRSSVASLLGVPCWLGTIPCSQDMKVSGCARQVLCPEFRVIKRDSLFFPIQVVVQRRREAEMAFAKQEEELQESLRAIGLLFFFLLFLSALLRVFFVYILQTD